MLLKLHKIMNIIQHHGFVYSNISFYMYISNFAYNTCSGAEVQWSSGAVAPLPCAIDLGQVFERCG